MSIQVIQIQPEFKQFTLYNPRSGLYKKKSVCCSKPGHTSITLVDI